MTASTDGGHIVVTSPMQGVALVTFNDPQSLNSMSHDFIVELERALTRVANDPAVRVVVLTGAGRGFSSGHGFSDIDGMGNGTPVAEQLRNQVSYSSLIVQIHELPQPVIAAVNGPAAGGGMAMALAADTRICSESARFNAAFVRLGISGCDVGVSYLLPRIVGPTLASEMMLTGRLVEAAEAHACGMVLDVVEDGKVVQAALGIAERILANSPFAVQMTKQTLRFGLDAGSLRQAIALEDRTQVVCLQSGDLHIALPAVRDKRTVSWPEALGA